MNTDMLSTKVVDGIAVVTLGSPQKMYFDMAMGDALTDELQAFAGDHNVRVVIITGGTPGYFNRHFDIPALIDIAEQIRASGRQWPDNASYHGGFFDKAMAICETMPKPVIAAISGTALCRRFRIYSGLRYSDRRGGRLPDRPTGNEPRPSARRKRNTKTSPHRRYGGRALAHSHG